VSTERIGKVARPVTTRIKQSDHEEVQVRRNVDRTTGGSLEGLVTRLERCGPSERIDFREDFLAFGEACIPPLANAAAREPDFVASVASWLVVLVERQPDTKPSVLKALSVLARGPNGNYAKVAVERLGGARVEATARPKRPGVQVRSAAEAEVHARMIQAARAGRILTYAELETNRGHVGRFLHNIGVAEAALRYRRPGHARGGQA
jgi:hypothetical protein